MKKEARGEVGSSSSHIFLQYLIPRRERRRYVLRDRENFLLCRYLVENQSFMETKKNDWSGGSEYWLKKRKSFLVEVQLYFFSLGVSKKIVLAVLYSLH